MSENRERREGRAARTFFPSFGVGIGVLLGSVLTSVSGSGAPGPSSLDVVDVTVAPVASFLGTWIVLAAGDALLDRVMRSRRPARFVPDGGDAEEEERESAEDE